jgi:hypothetical protein
MRALTLAGALMAAFVTIPGVAVAGAANNSASPETTATPAELSFRRDFGLRVDTEWLSSLSGASRSRWGVPLTDAEQVDLSHRLDVQAAATPLLKGLTVVQRAQLAGVYFDQAAAHGTLVLNFTANVEANDQVLRAAFPYPDMLRIGYARYSLDQLTQLVADTTAILSAPGLAWSAVARDDRNNQVVVDVPLGDPTGVGKLLALRLTSQPVVVRETDATNRTTNDTDTSAPPVIGGLGIFRQHESKVGYIVQCTSGYWAKKGTQDVLLTAGHCDVYMNKSSTLPWSVGDPTCVFTCTGNFPLGTMAASRFQNGFADDAGIISIPAGAAKAEVFDPTNSPNDRVSRVSTFLDGDDIVGAQTCSEGHTPGSNTPTNGCGGINNVDTTINYPAEDGYPTVQVPHCRLSSVYDQAGNSGGSVSAPTNDTPVATVYPTDPLGHYVQYNIHATGIISGARSSSTYGSEEIYTHVGYAMSDLGVTIPTE